MDKDVLKFILIFLQGSRNNMFSECEDPKVEAIKS